MNWWACPAHLCSSPTWQAGALHFLAHLDWDWAEACGEMISYHWTELTEGIDEEKQHRRDEMSVFTRKSDNEYDLCQTDATRINNNIKNSAHWLMRLSLTSQWDKNCLLQTRMKHELQMIPVLLTGRQPTVLCQCLFRIIFACLNLWLHKIIHIIPYQ